MEGIRGMQRFLQRVWRNLVTEDRKANLGGTPTQALEKLLHATILRVTDDVEDLRFNTAIAAMIELNNSLVQVERVPEGVARDFLRLLAPFAPHIAEEIWEIAELGDGGISSAGWPEGDPEKARSDMVEIPVQVNGKVRARFSVARDAARESVEALALNQPNVKTHLQGKAPKKIVVVPNRLVNIVV